jgi:hypothetical protein
LSLYLRFCYVGDFAYVTSESKGGIDDTCSNIISPCRTISYVLNENVDSDALTIFVLESDYSINSTDIGNVVVYLFPHIDDYDVADIVSILFDPSSTEGEGLFIMENGFLKLERLNLIHNGSSRGSFISISGAEGSLKMVWCVVYGSMSSSLLSDTLYSFIQITTEGEGEGDGTLKLIDVTFENISFSGTSSIVKAAGSISISISNSKFKSIRSSGGGSCVNVENVIDLNIISSDFEDINSTLDGGSVYFGEGSLKLTISSSTFKSCKSLNGNGGAIAYGSKSGTFLLLEGNDFNENSAGSEKKGNDYCDVTDDNSTLVLYDCSSLKSITSNSDSDKFFHLSAEFSLDIYYFSNLCISGYLLVFIDQNSEVEVDDENCGNYFSRCKTFEYVMNSVVVNSKEIIVLNSGSYDFTSKSLNSATLLVEGMITSYTGDVVPENVETYPKIIGSSTSYVNSGRIFNIDISDVTFRYIQFLFSPDSYSSLTFFYGFIYLFNYWIIFSHLVNAGTSTSSNLWLFDCVCSVVSMDGIEESLPRSGGFIQQDYGSVTAINSFFFFLFFFNLDFN